MHLGHFKKKRKEGKKKRGKKGKNREEMEGKKEKKGEKGEKEEKDKRIKKEVWWAKKCKWKAKKEYFAGTIQYCSKYTILYKCPIKGLKQNESNLQYVFEEL